MNLRKISRSEALAVSMKELGAALTVRTFPLGALGGALAVRTLPLGALGGTLAFSIFSLGESCRDSRSVPLTLPDSCVSASRRDWKAGTKPLESDDRYFVTFMVFCLTGFGLTDFCLRVFCLSAGRRNVKAELDGVKGLSLLIRLTSELLIFLTRNFLILLPRKFWELVSYRLGLKDEFHTSFLTAVLSKICNCQKRSVFNAPSDEM